MDIVTVHVSTLRFTFEPCIGRRSFYLTATLFGKTVWVMRWDTARSPKNRFRNGPMGWTWGKRKS